MMVDDGNTLTLYTSLLPDFSQIVSTLKTYSNTLSTSTYVGKPAIAMHPLDTTLLTVAVQVDDVPAGTTQVGFYTTPIS